MPQELAEHPLTRNQYYPDRYGELSPGDSRLYQEVKEAADPRNQVILRLLTVKSWLPCDRYR